MAVPEAALWALAAGALAVGVSGARWAPPASPVAAPARPSVRETAGVDPAPLARARERVVARDVFRIVRHASPVAFVASAPEGSAMPMMPTRPPAPMLVLRGIVGGPPWEAVIDGVPGRHGAVVVRAGDVLGGTSELRVRRVGADGVTITGRDSTWRLKVGDAGAPARRNP
jgi:hypothetical protein